MFRVILQVLALLAGIIKNLVKKRKAKPVKEILGPVDSKTESQKAVEKWDAMADKKFGKEEK